jgi:hypothetical protein
MEHAIAPQDSGAARITAYNIEAVLARPSESKCCFNSLRLIPSTRPGKARYDPRSITLGADEDRIPSRLKRLGLVPISGCRFLGFSVLHRVYARLEAVRRRG